MGNFSWKESTKSYQGNVFFLPLKVPILKLHINKNWVYPVQYPQSYCKAPDVDLLRPNTQTPKPLSYQNDTMSTPVLFASESPWGGGWSAHIVNESNVEAIKYTLAISSHVHYLLLAKPNDKCYYVQFFDLPLFNTGWIPGIEFILSRCLTFLNLLT